MLKIVHFRKYNLNNIKDNSNLNDEGDKVDELPTKKELDQEFLEAETWTNDEILAGVQ